MDHAARVEPAVRSEPTRKAGAAYRVRTTAPARGPISAQEISAWQEG
ncbi:hypothetical protein ACIBJD_09200 [Kitasatospora sp. NPDC050467]